MRNKLAALAFFVAASLFTPTGYSRSPERHGPHGRIIGGPSAVQQNQVSPSGARRPWEWTDEERIEARFNPTEMKKRLSPEELARYHVKLPSALQARSPRVAATTIPELIIGQRNPELFMPWELYASLVRNTFGAPQSSSDYMKREYENRAKSIGLAIPPGFWQRLEAVSAPLIARSSPNAKAATGAPLQREQQGRLLCGLRAQALSQMRSFYGTFMDRFLYQVVAPDQTTWSTEPISAERQRFIEAGCQ